MVLPHWQDQKERGKKSTEFREIKEGGEKRGEDFREGTLEKRGRIIIADRIKLKQSMGKSTDGPHQIGSSGEIRRGG